MKKTLLAAIFGSALFLAACGGDDSSSSDNGETAMSKEEQLVKQNCISCHGGQLEGRGNIPPLNDIGSRKSEEEILDIIVNGYGKGMPPGILKGEDAELAAKWLAEQK